MNHQDRIDATLRHMKDLNLALVAAFSNGEHSVTTPDAVALLSGVRPMGDCMVLLRADGRSTLYVTPAWDAARAERRSSTTVTLGTDDLPTAVAEAASRGEFGVGDVGAAALSRMARPVVDGVCAALGGEPKSVDEILIGIPQLTLAVDGPEKSAVAVSRCKTEQELARAQGNRHRRSRSPADARDRAAGYARI